MAVPDARPRCAQQVAQPLAGQPALAGQDRAVRGDGHIGQAGTAAGDLGKAERPQRILGQPAGACKADLDALASLCENIKKLGLKNSADVIADEVIKLATK